MKKIKTYLSLLLYALLVAILLVGCTLEERVEEEEKLIPRIVEMKYYTSFSGDLMPNGICRFFYRKSRFGDYIDTQEKCDCYQVGDTIMFSKN